MTKKDLAISIEGKAVVFRPVQEGDSIDEKRVVCPMCTKTVARQKARMHCGTCQGMSRFRKRKNDDEAGLVAGESPTKRAYSENQDTSMIWKRLRGSVPSSMLQSTMENMNAKAYHIDGYPMILTADTLEYLKSILPEDKKIIEICNEADVETVVQLSGLQSETHEPVTAGHLSVIENDGEEGLERLLGAIIVAGENSFETTVVETYSRDKVIDIHAELYDTTPSSAPTDEISTQYKGILKIAKVDDIASTRS
ncbi:hypothetical protein BGX20_003394 [Mortierella sp. AD010]|nr:hypothetical protein BGX20_003394 [Mortierella sp. AD010]